MQIKSYVINLDHRDDRLQSFISNRKEYGFDLLDFKRISAIRDEDFGGLGCAKSHLIALCDFLITSEFSHCLILEDDFRFRYSYDFFKNKIIELNNFDKEYKVFLLAGTNVIATEKGVFHEIFESQSTAGYLLSRSYVQTVISNFSRSIYLMEKFRKFKDRKLIYNRFSIDQTWKFLQQEGGWYSLFPMMGYQEESFSDIEKQHVNYENVSA
jgi:GR25 family glycosyltransferase involved in LPS biosynthesis